MMTALVHTSKAVPSRTAFAMPSGIEMRYTNSVVHSPIEIETGSFSRMSPMTERARKKLSPKSKTRYRLSMSKKRSIGGLSKP